MEDFGSCLVKIVRLVERAAGDRVAVNQPRSNVTAWVVSSSRVRLASSGSASLDDSGRYRVRIEQEESTGGAGIDSWRNIPIALTTKLLRPYNTYESLNNSPAPRVSLSRPDYRSSVLWTIVLIGNIPKLRCASILTLEFLPRMPVAGLVHGLLIN